MKKITCILLFLLLGSTRVLSQGSITVLARPASIWVEQGENEKFLNFDFLIKNTSKDSFELSKMAVFLFDEKNHLIHSRFLDNNGTAASILTIPNRKIAGQSSELIFNPFSEFNKSISLKNMVYELTFVNNKEEEIILKTHLTAKNYTPKEGLIFPLKGKILVYDGHDLYAHHRRFNYEFAPIKQLGLTANFMRYAYDFVLLDSAGSQFKGTGEKPENYYGFGKPVISVADGTVIYASNSHKDDKTFDVPKIANNPLELYGNCIAVQHRDSSISIYGHLKQNSLKVMVGDRVKMGHVIGAIGLSGSSFFPHLHFEMRTSIQGSAEGLPSSFSNVYLLEGDMPTRLRSGNVETGNVILTKMVKGTMNKD